MSDLFSVKPIHNNSLVVTTPVEDILLFCPPETLKHLITKSVNVPSIIILPPDIAPGQELGSSGFVRKGINYACFEFILYYNFFVAGGKKTKIITTTKIQAQRVKIIIQEVILGPFHLYPDGDYDWLQNECIALTEIPPLGTPPSPSDMAGLFVLQDGPLDLGEQVALLYDGNHFVFFTDDGEELRISADINDPAMPLVVSPPRPLIKQEITLQFVGSGDGFDPNEITTCFLAYLSSDKATQTILFDAAAYLAIRLGNLGLSLNQIQDVVITHVHEDHIAGLPELLLMGQNRIRLVTSDLVHRSLLRLLSAVLNVTENDVMELYDFHQLNPGNPLILDSLQFESIYAIHSIPTIAVRVNGLCYSGDMVYNETLFRDLERNGVITAARRYELENFANDAVILVQDVGGGSIHTTLTSEVFKALANKSQHLILAHTSKHHLPEGSEDMVGKVEFATGGLVKAIGEVMRDPDDAYHLETISACPLYSRLPIDDRIELARQSSTENYQAGQFIMHTGDEYDGNSYIVHSGLIEVWVDDRCILVMGRGSSIGERGALYNDPRTGTLIARTDVSMLVFSQEMFTKIADKLALKEAFARAEWLWRNPSFGHFAWATLLDLALDFIPRLIEPGDKLFMHGDVGGDCYLLVSGVLSLLNNKGEPLATFREAGEFFGGRTALEGKTHRVSVIAAQRSEVWVLPFTGLQRLHMVYPNVLFHLKAVDIG